MGQVENRSGDSKHFSVFTRHATIKSHDPLCLPYLPRPQTCNPHTVDSSPVEPIPRPSLDTPAPPRTVLQKCAVKAAYPPGGSALRSSAKQAKLPPPVLPLYPLPCGLALPATPDTPSSFTPSLHARQRHPRPELAAPAEPRVLLCFSPSASLFLKGERGRSRAWEGRKGTCSTVEENFGLECTLRPGNGLLDESPFTVQRSSNKKCTRGRGGGAHGECCFRMSLLSAGGTALYQDGSNPIANVSKIKHRVGWLSLLLALSQCILIYFHFPPLVNSILSTIKVSLPLAQRPGMCGASWERLETASERVCTCPLPSTPCEAPRRRHKERRRESHDSPKLVPNVGRSAVRV